LAQAAAARAVAGVGKHCPSPCCARHPAPEVHTAMAEEEKEAARQEDVKAEDPDQSLADTLTASRTAVFNGTNPASEAVEDASAELAEPDFVSTAGTMLPLQACTDLNSLTMPAAAELSPQESSRRQKPLSLLGASLSKKPATREGNNDPDSPKRSKSIVDRYAAEVRESDQARKIGYLPMQQQLQFTPAGLDVAKDLQAELGDLARAVGGAHNVSKAVGWDALLGNDKFQKRMQFLHEHSRTGHFVEQYGADGKYEGEFLHGMRHGKGRYEFKGEIYDGEWKWDNRHGLGLLNCNDGTTIEGEWQNGKPHGLGKVVDKKGTVVYEGEFKDGKRHGLGRQVFESGDMYDGGWQQGRLHDRGVYYFTNGDRLYGMWQEGVYHGVGVFHYADGSISRREYEKGLLKSVQDYEHSTTRFGKTLRKDGMQKHTRDRDFPKEVFLLNSV